MGEQLMDILNANNNSETAVKSIITDSINNGEEYIVRVIDSKLSADDEARFLLTTSDNKASYMYIVNYIAQKYNILYGDQGPITEENKQEVIEQLNLYIQYNGEIGILNSRFFRMEKLPELLSEDISIDLEPVSDKTNYKKMTVSKKEKLR